MSELIDNYRYFLWLFHVSEYEYYKIHGVETSFDPTIVSERLEDTVRLVGEFVNEGKGTNDHIRL